jgi:hypothetical protein
MGFSGKESGGSVTGNLESAAQSQIAAAQQAGQIAQQYANLSLDQVKNYYNQAVSNLNSFYNQGIAQTAGYNLAGSTALDSLMQSMGLPTVQGGSYAFNQKGLELNRLQNQLTAQNPNQVSESDLKNQIQSLLPGAQTQAQFLGGGGYGGSGNAATDIGTVQQYEQQFGGQLPGDLRFLSDVANRSGSYGSISTDANYAAQNLSKIQQLQKQYDQLQTQATPEAQAQQQQIKDQITQLQQQIQNPTMQQTANPLTGYANSAQGKLTNYDPNKSLVENFQQTSPGYQFQKDQGQNAIRSSMAAQGLLNNPALMAALDQYTVGLANQSFGSYQQNLQSSLGNYQQSLAGLASGGLQTGLANQNAAQNTGNNLSNAALGTGSNVANIYGNLGNTLANSALAQGQAQANMYNNMANYGSQQQQGMGQLGGLLGAGIGTYMGGPTGGAAGGKIGGAIGGLLGTSL